MCFEKDHTSCLWVVFRVYQFSEQIILSVCGGLGFLVYFYLSVCICLVIHFEEKDPLSYAYIRITHFFFMSQDALVLGSVLCPVNTPWVSRAGVVVVCTECENFLRLTLGKRWVITTKWIFWLLRQTCFCGKNTWFWELKDPSNVFGLGKNSFSLGIPLYCRA